MDLDIVGALVVFSALVILGALVVGVGHAVIACVLLVAARSKRRAHAACRACGSRLPEAFTETACPGCRRPLAEVGTIPTIEPTSWSMVLASLILTVLLARLPWWVLEALS